LDTVEAAVKVQTRKRARHWWLSMAAIAALAMVSSGDPRRDGGDAQFVGEPWRIMPH
jgi:hypothetical protein